MEGLEHLTDPKEPHDGSDDDTPDDEDLSETYD